MKDFAKLFRADDVGQVLVTAGKDDEGDPAITFEVDTGGGRLSVSLGYHSIDDAQKALDLIDEEAALGVARGVISHSPFSSLIKAE